MEEKEGREWVETRGVWQVQRGTGGHTKTFRQVCVLERGEWRGEVVEMSG